MKYKVAQIRESNSNMPRINHLTNDIMQQKCRGRDSRQFSSDNFSWDKEAVAEETHQLQGQEISKGWPRRHRKTTTLLIFRAKSLHLRSNNMVIGQPATSGRSIQ